MPTCDRAQLGAAWQDLYDWTLRYRRLAAEHPEIAQVEQRLRALLENGGDASLSSSDATARAADFILHPDWCAGRC
jgi:hypothetical protein